MERAEFLSEILRDQIRSGASRESLLWTLGMIRSEILAMPASSISPAAPETGKPAEEAGADSAVRMLKPEAPRYAVNQSGSDIESLSGSPPELSSLPSKQVLAAVSPAATTPVRGSQQSLPVEINQRVADGGDSLNDRLRQDAPELAERLMKESVTDLRRSFGINDRFRFIHELFRGDGAAFDAAVSRLDGMSGVSEALLHIDRELSFQWGWEAADPMVEQLRQSVRRRFSVI
jgi:hypothetical protein